MDRTTAAPQAFVPVSISWRSMRVEVPGQSSGTDHLFLTPDLDRDGRVKGRWVLTHAPTGRALSWDTEPLALREIAARIADLDWSSDDPNVYAINGKHHTALRAAREAVAGGDAYGEDDEDWDWPDD